MTLLEITKEQKFTADCQKSIRQVEANMKTLKPSRERATALTKIQEARMWLAEDMARLTKELIQITPTNKA